MNPFDRSNLQSISQILGFLHQILGFYFRLTNIYLNLNETQPFSYRLPTSSLLDSARRIILMLSYEGHFLVAFNCFSNLHWRICFSLTYIRAWKSLRKCVVCEVVMYYFIIENKKEITFTFKLVKLRNDNTQYISQNNNFSHPINHLA